MKVYVKKYIELANFISKWSKDRSTKVGCVIVGPDKEVRSMGYNGFPRGVNDNIDERHKRPLKYCWTEHAERNAIYNAARVGTSLKGCTIYLHWFPCTDCARAIIQSGMITVVARKPDFKMPKWGPDFKISRTMLTEANINIIYGEDL